MNLKRVKLALSKMIANFEEVTYEGTVYLWDGTLDYGVEVYQEGVDELIPAENGEFVFDGVSYTIEGGLVVKIDGVEAPVEEEVVEEEQLEEAVEEEEVVEEEGEEVVGEEEELEAIDGYTELIAELREEVEELKSIVAMISEALEQSNADLDTFKKQVAAIPMAKAAEVEIKESGKISNNGAAKYFQALQ